MKVLTAILLLALAMGVAPVFAEEVSAADQTTSPLVVKEENKSENISDLDVATKPDITADAKNSTISELATTGIVPVQNENDSKEIRKDANSNNLQSWNSRELTTKGMKTIKAQGWIEDAAKFVADVILPIGKLLRPEIGINASGNNSSWHFSLNAHAASKTQKSKKYKR